jgi:hypothetical protein
MTRTRTLIVTILPSMVLGGFLFASQSGHAESGRDGSLGFWPDTPTGVVVAQADPWAGRPRARVPAPPTAPVPPTPPTPPSPPSRKHGHNRGMSISIHDGKVEIDGIQDMVQEQLDAVTRMLDTLPNVPPDVRERLKSRARAVREKLKSLGKLKSMDLDKIGPEMERMGDEIEKEMEGLDKDLEQLGDKFGKSFSDKFGRDFAKRVGPGPGRPPSVDHSDSSDSDDGEDDSDDDDDKDAGLPPSVDDAIDPSDVHDQIAALKALPLDPGQKAKLAKLRAESDEQIKSAKAELDEMSNKLHAKLGDASVNESEVSSLIDRISSKEAVIRKARILTYVRARKLFDRDQQKKIDAVVKKGH